VPRRVTPATPAARGEVKPAPEKPPAPPRAVAPTPPPAPAPPAPAAATPPATAAVTAPVEKPPDPAALFTEAQSAMIRGDYLAAIAGFEATLKVDPSYPNAANLLGVARGGAKNASQLAVDSGNKAEMSGDYAGATTQYQRALQLDPPSTAASDAMRRLKIRMQNEGEDTFKQARQYDALGRKQDAISAYEKTLLLLPAEHASVKISRERLAALKGGG
jgi:tetratricopeptide (TPR) repeat protein